MRNETTGEQPATPQAVNLQVVNLRGDAVGPRFDGIGIVHLPNIGPQQWHNLKLRFDGSTLTGLVDDEPVLSATDTLYARGMAGLMAGQEEHSISTPFFDNVLINAPGAPVPESRPAMPGQSPIYKRPLA